MTRMAFPPFFLGRSTPLGKGAIKQPLKISLKKSFSPSDTK
jgi:hypothetical protein